MKLLIALALLGAPTLANAEALELLCRGTALTASTTTTTGSISEDFGTDSATIDSMTMSTVRTQETLRIRIDDAGAGSIKLPPVFIPSLSRGKDGWWTFTALDMGDDTIRGQFSMNILNKPKVVIDRRTGDIDLKGLSMRFSGSCERVEAAPEARKF